LSAVVNCNVSGRLKPSSFAETTDKQSFARASCRSAINWMNIPMESVAGCRALNMRSTTCGASTLSAGDHDSVAAARLTKRGLSVSKSGCRLFHTIDGMSLSWPQ
jgi:hypothetical protein